MAALLLATACVPRANAEPAPLNLLFITVDTLRADHLSGYGYRRETSPALDSFFDESVVFEDAHSNSSWTLPALASMMTSHYMATHGCVNFYTKLDASFVTLAEILRNAGYRTGGIGSHSFLKDYYGLQQGIPDFDEELVYGLRESHEAVSSVKITMKAVRWLERRAPASKEKGPWFLWAHYFDPHSVYMEHEGISERFGTKRRIDLYDGEIAFTDRQIGVLLEKVVELGFAETTVVVFVSDHGEEFRERGLEQHGKTLFREVMHVPLAIRDPRLAPRRVSSAVQGVDLLPTLLELLDIPNELDVAGRSLVPAMRGEPIEDRAILGEVRVMDAFEADALIQGRWKLIADRSGALVRSHSNRIVARRPEKPSEASPAFLLFDRKNDPFETQDVAAEHPELVAELRATLEAMLKRARERKRDFQVSEKLTLSPGELEKLRSLGYVEQGQPE